MDKEQKAIARIRLAAQMSERYYKKPVLLCYSGGKDSDVLLELAKRSGAKFEVQHSLTTVDAPPTIYHIRDVFTRLEDAGIKCKVDKRKTTMWKLIVRKKYPPTRLARYCCEELKEQAGKNRHILTGVRWSESKSRKGRGIFEDINADKSKKIILSNDDDDRRLLTERCEILAKTVTNPVIDWENKDVADYISSEKIDINPLYCQGYNRIGCIGCPMAGRKMRLKEFADFPAYKKAYIRAFDKMIDARKSSGLGVNEKWTSGRGVFEWWMENPDYIDGQMSFFQ